jgi:hypothetical protein
MRFHGTWDQTRGWNWLSQKYVLKHKRWEMKNMTEFTAAKWDWPKGRIGHTMKSCIVLNLGAGGWEA